MIVSVHLEVVVEIFTPHSRILSPGGEFAHPFNHVRLQFADRDALILVGIGCAVL